MFRHVFPFVLMVLTLLIARQIYPYTSFMQPEVPDGFSIEVVATNLGGPTCLEWYDEDTLLLCDRDDGRILVLDEEMNRSTLISGLNKPHDIAITTEHIFVSEAGDLLRFDHTGLENITNETTLIAGIPTGNHQTNAVNILPNGTLIWHSGST